MQSDDTATAYLVKFWPWFEANLKRIAWGAGIAALAIMVVAFFVWQQNQKNVNAGMALTRAGLTLPDQGQGDLAAALGKVAADYPGTSSGARALLQAAATQFADGKYPEAQAQFQRFLDTYPDNIFGPQASLGVAACLDAQNKTEEAVKAYKNVISLSPDDNAFAQAKFSLARIYDAQRKYADARDLYQDVARAYPYSSLGQEALIRMEELKQPSPAAPPAVPARPQSFMLSSTNLLK